MIRTQNGSLYTGITTDIGRRLDEHERGKSNGSKYLRAKGPLQVVFASELGSRALASRAEAAIKRLTKRRKEQLVLTLPTAQELLSRLGLDDADAAMHSKC